MLALRKSRMASTHPFLRGAFRPFFFSGAAWGLVALMLWIASLAGALVLPSAMDPLAWHRHEMMFGFVGAVIAGFLLTAIPNWTGRLPIAGPPLAWLVGLWFAARLAVLFSSVFGTIPAAVLDVGFYFTLAFVGAREVFAAKNRNVPVVGLVLLFGLANAVDHLAIAGVIESSELGWMFAVSLVILMISLIGGRIVPSFTRNWLVKQGVSDGLPSQPGRFDVLVIGATALALLFWITGPSGWVTGGLLGVAAALQAARLARWGGLRAARDPLVLVLHVGYAWIPIGVALLGASAAGTVIARSVAVHALTAGAMATMILAVMTRASLGHTGRELKAGPATTAIYALVTLGALLRVAAPLELMDYQRSIEVAGLAWGGALLLFLMAYTPVLWRPRLGEKPA
jgi:uncharacterized protein involved in response to NO